jgi:hypothetical protein
VTPGTVAQALNTLLLVGAQPAVIDLPADAVVAAGHRNVAGHLVTETRTVNDVRQFQRVPPQDSNLRHRLRRTVEPSVCAVRAHFSGPCPCLECPFWPLPTAVHSTSHSTLTASRQKWLVVSSRERGGKHVDTGGPSLRVGGCYSGSPVSTHRSRQHSTHLPRAASEGSRFRTAAGSVPGRARARGTPGE